MRTRGGSGWFFIALTLSLLFTPFGRGQTEVAPSRLPDPDPPLATEFTVRDLESPAASDAVPPPPRDVPVWGLAGLRGFASGEQVAPNGVEFNPLFSLEMNFNFWVCRSERVYLFADDTFWGQRAAPGVTNPSQGAFDFSKREFDFSGGAAWNYYGPFEARAFAYSFNNLNRGDSTTHPTGYADGIGLENRWYLSDIYAALGTDAFDEARATFVSAGFYPTKDMVDGRGVAFKPGPFARADLTFDLAGERCYLYGDGEFIGTQSWTPKLLKLDAGVAARPWDCTPRLEFRLGTADTFDLRNGDLERSFYGAVRIVY